MYSDNRIYSKGIPKYIIVKIELPLCNSIQGIDLDINQSSLKLTGLKYNLYIDLPYGVNEDEGPAKFDKTKKILTVKLPVIIPKNEPKPFIEPKNQEETEENTQIEREKEIKNENEKIDHSYFINNKN